MSYTRGKLGVNKTTWNFPTLNIYVLNILRDEQQPFIKEFTVHTKNVTLFIDIYTIP